MAVDHIGQSVLALEVSQGVVGKTLQRVPQHLLGQIFLFAALNARNARFIRQGFIRFSVVGVNLIVDDATGHQDHFFDIASFAQRPGKFHNIFGLPAGIRVAS